jgi:4-hydroxy-3-methylbut-2-en-1-yl diphosphate reductase
LGLTAGASAPELLVREIVNHLSKHFQIDEQQVTTAEESIIFKLPRELTEPVE